MIGISAVAKTWEELAQQDALWAILTDPDKRAGRWTVNEFMDTGSREIATILSCLNELKLLADFDSTALDFGCGVGRLSRALSFHFRNVVGLDISETMIAHARSMNADR